MRAKRRIGGILLIIVALVIMQLPVSEADAATSASDFKITGTTLEKYLGTEKSVSVPFAVETIGKSAFEDNKELESISFPGSVTDIEEYAFWGCSALKKVRLSQGMSQIGDFAFANCKGLEDIVIPSSITSIGIQAFADCVNLKEITIPPQVVFIHETAFDGCTKLIIHSEEGSYGSKYAKAFYERQKEMPEYEDVYLYDPDHQIPEQNQNTVSDNDVDNRDYLGTTSVVGNHAVLFIDNTSQTVYSGPVYEGIQIDADASDLVITAGTIPKYCIVDKKTVADQAYYKNTAIKNVVLPEGITEVGEFSFARSSLQTITLPMGVKNICYGAFYHCDDLVSVELPDSIENVEPNAFAHTRWLADFYNDQTKDYLISGSTLIAYSGNQKAITIPEGVKVIASQAFKDHKEISSVKFPDSLEVVGEEAFYGCSNLSNLFFGNKIKKIKDRAFDGCDMESFQIPASVTELGVSVFGKNAKLTFLGKEPQYTYESTATRLSNDTLRDTLQDEGIPGVVIEGINGAVCEIEGITDKYYLKVNAQKESTAFRLAFRRNLHSDMPTSCEIYELTLTDDSKIPIYKLGKQRMTMILPIGDSFSLKNVNIVILDRNGQLEALESKMVTANGKTSVMFTTNKVGSILLYPTDEERAEEELLEMSGDISQMSGPVLTDKQEKVITPFLYFKWISGGLILIMGLILALKKVE